MPTIHRLACSFLLALACASVVAAPAGWREHRDPQGFSVSLPPGWQAGGGKGGRIELKGEGAQVRIQPLVARAALESRQMALLLARFAEQWRPGVAWQSLPSGSPHSLQAHGEQGGERLLVAVAWVQSDGVTQVMLYGFAAPAGRFARLAPSLSTVAASLRLAGPAEAAVTAPRYRAWTDPQEQAFTVEVPSGWRVEGGVNRMAPVDVRPAWALTDPSGAIRVWSGDAQIPPFTLPSPLLSAAGFGIGSWYSPGYGVNFQVQPYMDGGSFAEAYVRNGLKAFCGGEPQITRRERPDAVAAINAVNRQYANMGIYTALSAGEVDFSCQGKSGPITGYYFAATRQTQSQGGGLWNVEHLYGYLAPVSGAALGRSVLSHAVGSFRFNPQWLRMQQNVTADTSRIVAQTQSEISELISQAHRQRNQTLDEIDRRRSNAILEVEDVVDPQTGRSFKVESGSNYYWIDARGKVVGTDVDARPDLNFRALLRLP